MAETSQITSSVPLKIPNDGFDQVDFTLQGQELGLDIYPHTLVLLAGQNSYSTYTKLVKLRQEDDYLVQTFTRCISLEDEGRWLEHSLVTLSAETHRRCFDLIRHKVQLLLEDREHPILAIFLQCSSILPDEKESLNQLCRSYRYSFQECLFDVPSQRQFTTQQSPIPLYLSPSMTLIPLYQFEAFEQCIVPSSTLEAPTQWWIVGDIQDHVIEFFRLLEEQLHWKLDGPSRILHLPKNTGLILIGNYLCETPMQLKELVSMELVEFLYANLEAKTNLILLTGKREAEWQRYFSKSQSEDDGEQISNTSGIPEEILTKVKYLMDRSLPFLHQPGGFWITPALCHLVHVGKLEAYSLSLQHTPPLDLHFSSEQDCQSTHFNSLLPQLIKDGYLPSQGSTKIHVKEDGENEDPKLQYNNTEQENVWMGNLKYYSGHFPLPEIYYTSPYVLLCTQGKLSAICHPTGKVVSMDYFPVPKSPTNSSAKQKKKKHSKKKNQSSVSSMSYDEVKDKVSPNKITINEHSPHPLENAYEEKTEVLVMFNEKVSVAKYPLEQHKLPESTIEVFPRTEIFPEVLTLNEDSDDEESISILGTAKDSIPISKTLLQAWVPKKSLLYQQKYLAGATIVMQSSNGSESMFLDFPQLCSPIGGQIESVLYVLEDLANRNKVEKIKLVPLYYGSRFQVRIVSKAGGFVTAEKITCTLDNSGEMKPILKDIAKYFRKPMENFGIAEMIVEMTFRNSEPKINYQSEIVALEKLLRKGKSRFTPDSKQKRLLKELSVTTILETYLEAQKFMLQYPDSFGKSNQGTNKKIEIGVWSNFIFLDVVEIHCLHEPPWKLYGPRNSQNTTSITSMRCDSFSWRKRKLLRISANHDLSQQLSISTPEERSNVVNILQSWDQSRPLHSQVLIQPIQPESLSQSWITNTYRGKLFKYGPFHKYDLLYRQYAISEQVDKDTTVNEVDVT
jgi:hypothetical protein